MVVNVHGQGEGGGGRTLVNVGGAEVFMNVQEGLVIFPWVGPPLRIMANIGLGPTLSFSRPHYLQIQYPPMGGTDTEGFYETDNIFRSALCL